MIRSLSVKLIFSFLIVSLIGTVLIAVLAGRTTAREFGHYMFWQNHELIVTGLVDYYRTHGGWDGVENVMPSGRGSAVNGGGPRPAAGMALADPAGLVIVNGAHYAKGSQLSPSAMTRDSTIMMDGEVIGYLLTGESGSLNMNSAGADFLAGINRILILASLGATAVALLLAVVLARTLTYPLRELTGATRAVAAGDLDQQVPVRSHDELGQLAESFNRMSNDLVRSQALRREMTADVAHELRTPLTIIQGHAEALRDGVIPATKDNLAVLYDEAVHINRLVEDLRTLSLAEAGELSLHRQAVAPEVLLQRAAASHGARAIYQNITLQTTLAPDLPLVDADPDRIVQALSNLLDNSLRHTPAGGRVTLTAHSEPDTATGTARVRLQVRDTGPGIAPDDLSRVFERFYRADKSRQRDQSGSGLGLAIAKSIVEAHAGRIWAESKLGEGTEVTVELPALV